MSKKNPPKIKPISGLVTTPPVPNACDISAVPAMVQSLGLVNFNVTCKNGQLTVSGTNQGGQKVRVSGYQANGYTEGSMSSFQPSTIDARRAEANRLKSLGLTQQEIADRLGVSQKTISNDLQ